ncbi:hypothetical protein Leryth_003579 [Lithospermum erythrorhizon]|nr:hypothetical protein Leryth_003579 [Lithospermum erythrorhizon]
MASTFWCHQCNTLVNVSDETTIHCPLCTTGFLVARIPHRVAAPASAPVSPPESGLSSIDDSDSGGGGRLSFRRRRRRSTGNTVPTDSYNPIILMRTPPMTPGGTASLAGTDSASGERLFRLYYEVGGRTGLRPLPPTMTEFLLGPGFDRLLDQLSQLEMTRPDNNSNAPACKVAVESMPVVEIEPSHVGAELDCSVCHEEFEMGSEAREMPCKHLYHSECIIPWLAIRNSCPICRHELASETRNDDNQGNDNSNSGGFARNGNSPFGISIWRLPSGGYAVGRFSGSGNAMPTTISLDSRRSGGGMRRLFGGFVSFCKRVMSSSSSSPSFFASLNPSEIPRNRSMSIS